MSNTATWTDVRRALHSGFHIAFNYDLDEPVMRLPADARVLCCNNGWAQATTPRMALAVLRHAT